jgi:hypothetical protein
VVCVCSVEMNDILIIISISNNSCKQQKKKPNVKLNKKFLASSLVF